ARGDLQEADRRQKIYVVGKAFHLRKGAHQRLENEGYFLTFFADEAAFSAELKVCIPACIIVVVDATHSNMDLIRSLRKGAYPAPVLAFSELGISTAVEAVKRGAFDFMEMRNSDDEIAGQILRAVQSFSRVESNESFNLSPTAFRGSEPLTCREMEVLRH